MRFWAQGIWLGCGIIAAALSARPANAVLGGRVGVANLVHPATGGSAYSLLETQSSGSSIREFADRDGTVFAVAWSGIKHPDLKSLFGEHFKDYRQALAHAEYPRWKTAWIVKNDEIVVRLGGHMGGVRGFAYLPSRVPAGVSIEDLR